jgi:hypothetical protein
VARAPSRKTEALHIVALSGFAVAQPTFDILSRNGTFFVAHRSSATEILVLAAALVIGVPLALVVLERVVALLSMTAYRILHVVLVFALAGLAAAPPISRALDLSTMGWLVAFAAVGAVVAAVYSRRRRFFAGITWLSVAPVVFVGFFLLGSPVREILLPTRLGPVNLVTKRDAPVVFLLFDGISLGTLMNPDGEIDRTRFPNFARLARRSTWYRSVSTVAEPTQKAVPAVLTGRWPVSGRFPYAKDYPDNLFTLLGGNYRVHVSEWITYLCPPSVCESAPSESAGLSLLLEDSSIVYGHVALPRKVAATRLPPIDAAWTRFGRAATGANLGPDPLEHRAQRKREGKTSEDTLNTRDLRLQGFDRLLTTIDKPASHTLWFAHVGLPHRPFQFLPTGQIYQSNVSGKATPGISDGRWTDDERLVVHGLQRYLLQLKLVDRVLGRLIDRLEATDVWDDAMVVVTADHGKAFVAGERIRVLEDRNRAQILSMPLFIKYPGQTEGRVDRRFAETVDVVPTIADVLGIEAPYRFQGASLLADAPARSRRRVLTAHDGFQTFDRSIPGLRRVAHDIAELFGRGGGADDLFDWGRHQIVGTETEDLSISRDVVGTVTLDRPEDYEDVDTDARLVPVMVEATIAGLDPSTPIGVALNGTIAGTGWTYRDDEERTRITVLVSPRYLVDGDNEIEVFEILSDEELRPLELS